MKRLLLVNDYHEGGGAEEIVEEIRRGLSPEFCIETHFGKEKVGQGPPPPWAYISSRAEEKKLQEHLNAFLPDIIHVHNYYHVLTPSILDLLQVYKKSRQGLRFFHTAHDFHLILPNSGGTRRVGWIHPREIRAVLERPSIGQRFFWCWDRRGYLVGLAKSLQWQVAYVLRQRQKTFDSVIAPSQFLLDALAHNYPDLDLHLIRNPAPRHDGVKKRSHPSLREPCVLFAGRISPEKGLLPFFHSLGKQRVSLGRWLIFGEGQELPLLKDLFLRWNVHSVKFLGRRPREEVVRAMSEADAVLLPSIFYENAPLSLVEGAFAGKWLLAADHGGSRETAKICAGEFLFHPFDQQSIQRAFDSFLEAVKREISPVRDRKKLAEIYSRETFLQAHKELYSS